VATNRRQRADASVPSSYSDFVAPFQALLSTREARGTFAESALVGFLGCTNVYEVHPVRQRLLAGTSASQLPLGWYLSPSTLLRMDVNLFARERPEAMTRAAAEVEQIAARTLNIPTTRVSAEITAADGLPGFIQRLQKERTARLCGERFTICSGMAETADKGRRITEGGRREIESIVAMLLDLRRRDELVEVRVDARASLEAHGEDARSAVENDTHAIVAYLEQQGISADRIAWRSTVQSDTKTDFFSIGFVAKGRPTSSITITPFDE
jgi:hypothetical protein